jgi:hypothetical protein
MTEDIDTTPDLTSEYPTITQGATHQRRVDSAMERYQDGYFQARTIDGFGRLIKRIAWIVGIFLILTGYLGYADIFGSRNSGVIGLILCVLPGVATGFLIYIIGVLVQAAGQLLMAHFDCAVNGSHFLSDDQRAQVMSLK